MYNIVTIHMAFIQEIFESSEQNKKRLNKESHSCCIKKTKIKFKTYRAGINLIDRKHIGIKYHELGRMNHMLCW